MKLALQVAYHCIFFIDLTNGWTSLASSPRRAASTCPARTVNHITHSLPQLCLSSSRSPHTRYTASNATATKEISSPSTNATNSVSPSLEIAANDVITIKTPEGEGEPVSASTSTKGATNAVETPKSLDNTRTSDIGPIQGGNDSPLDKANFLSFEEWRRRNLLKMGQPEQIGQNRPPHEGESRKREINVHHALEALSDGNEIDLDFSGFVPTHVSAPTLTGHQQLYASETSRSEKFDSKSRGYRKEAGKTSNKRFNYASFDCAANVLKTNTEAKGALAVLGENKDSYMLNECSASTKLIILELCQDIQIDTVVLANFEFFSSTFRTFRVSISDRYPAKADKWQELGVFEARNSREIQSFLVENPIIWARYIRIEFLSHYGNEYYCPLSLVRIHGRTMLEEYKLDADIGHGDDDEIDEKDEAELVPIPIPSDQPQAELHFEAASNKGSPNGTISMEQDPPIHGTRHDEAPYLARDTFGTHDAVAMTNYCPSNTRTTEERMARNLFRRHSTCGIDESPSGATSPEPLLTSIPTSFSVPKVASTDIIRSVTINTSHEPAHDRHGASSNNGTMLSHHNATLREDETTDRLAANATVQPSKVTSSANSTHTEPPSLTSSYTSPPTPTVQDSFFKSVQKRLHLLETNSSLSLQYIEEQSRALSEAFMKVEQRQLAKTSDFLHYLNTTVLNELKDFRQQYDQLWQSTVIELEIQREQFQQESTAINARLGILASEVVFQKRLSILQMVLIILALGLVLFSKSDTKYFELPSVQSTLRRTRSRRWIQVSALDTPSRSPSASRPGSSHKFNNPPVYTDLDMRHLQPYQQSPGDAELDGPESIERSTTGIYSPPSPESLLDWNGLHPSDGDTVHLQDHEISPSPRLAVSATEERPRSSPSAFSNASLDNQQLQLAAAVESSGVRE